MPPFVNLFNYHHSPDSYYFTFGDNTVYMTFSEPCLNSPDRGAKNVYFMSTLSSRPVTPLHSIGRSRLSYTLIYLLTYLSYRSFLPS